MDDKTKYRTQGIAAALAEAFRAHGEDVLVRNVLEGLGIEINDLRSAGVESYDLDAITKAVLQGGGSAD